MRLFVAVDIPTNTEIEGVMSYVKKAGKVKAVEKENLHITLKFLGEVSDDKLSDIKNCIESSCKNFKKFSIKLKGLGAFPSLSKPRVIWIGVDEGKDILSEIMRRLDECFHQMGFKKEKSYVPHITIARVKGFIKLDPRPYLKKDFGSVIVEEIKLKKSQLTPKGPIYDDIFVLELQE